MRIPLTVRTVADVIGMDAAVRLMQVRHPNGYIYVPQGDRPSLLRSEKQINKILTPDEMRAITRAFGGEMLPYPSGRGIKRRIAAERKAKAILNDITSGLSTADIVAKHGVSAQYVRRIRTKGSTSSGWQRPRKDER